MTESNEETGTTQFKNARELLKNLTDEEKRRVVDYLTERIKAVVLVTARDSAEQSVNTMFSDLDFVSDGDELLFNIRVRMTLADLMEAAGFARQVSWGLVDGTERTVRESYNQSRLHSMPIDKPFWFNLTPWFKDEESEQWHISLTTKRGGGGKAAIHISLTVNDLLELAQSKAPHKAESGP